MSADFTKVKITYDDGSVEPSGPTLPLVIQARDDTFTNSVSGGQIVTTKTRLISGMIPGVITRDNPFTLELEGYFTLDNGSTIPFSINQQYDVVVEKTTKPGKEVMQDK